LRKIKIIHILEDYSILSGGIRTVVKNLHEELLKNGYASKILTPFAEKDDDVIMFKINKKAPWCYSSQLKKILTNLLKENKIDIIHIHGVWMYPQYYASKFSITNKIPFIISFHGMYEPWLWKTGYLKKKFFSNLLTNSKFSKASFLHAITPNEAYDLNKRFPQTPVKEIPNLIHADRKKIHSSIQSSKKNILYLGRLDPIKGIDLLIKAFQKIKFKDINLKIVGPKNEYFKELESLVNTLSLNKQVEFLGLKTGKEKEKILNEAILFVAPSYSEVIGMVNLEAAMAGIPVITTIQTGLDKEWSTNGGMLINPNELEIKNAIEYFLSLPEDIRLKKGEELKDFVIKNYSWENRFIDWDELYRTIIG